MVSTLNDKEKAYLKKTLGKVGILRFIAIVIIITSMLFMALILINPAIVLGPVLAGPSVKRITLEQYFSSLQPQTELEKELLASNIQWNNFVWNFFLLTNIRIVSMSAAYLLGMGILVLFFSGLLQKIKELVDKMKKNDESS